MWCTARTPTTILFYPYFNCLNEHFCALFCICSLLYSLYFDAPRCRDKYDVYLSIVARLSSWIQTVTIWVHALKCREELVRSSDNMHKPWSRSRLFHLATGVGRLRTRTYTQIRMYCDNAMQSMHIYLSLMAPKEETAQDIRSRHGVQIPLRCSVLIVNHSSGFNQNIEILACPVLNDLRWDMSGLRVA
jgi:hypothetical protein